MQFLHLVSLIFATQLFVTSCYSLSDMQLISYKPSIYIGYLILSSESLEYLVGS